MNRDQIKGKVEELKGRAREAFGSAKETAKDQEKEAAGQVERAKGAVEGKAAETKEAIERKRDDEGAAAEKGEPGSDKH